MRRINVLNSFRFNSNVSSSPGKSVDLSKKKMKLITDRWSGDKIIPKLGIVLPVKAFSDNYRSASVYSDVLAFVIKEELRERKGLIYSASVDFEELSTKSDVGYIVVKIQVESKNV